MTGKTITLNGYSLTLKDAQAIAAGAPVRIAAAVRAKVVESRKLVEKLAKGSKPVYGVNTGFGHFATKRIADTDLGTLQTNILKSHAAGWGGSLSIEETRLAMVLRLNLMLKGHSGVRYELCEALHNLIEAEIYPVIPEYGSVGASGDLIPLAHMALPLIGEGQVRYKGAVIEARAALKKAGLKPIKLAAKEGLCLVNGTEIMQAVGGLALAKALKLADVADKVVALTFEGMEGLVDALSPLVHEARGQTGQIESARNILNELKGSYLHKGKLHHNRVQDPYSLRCAAQIHGASRDALHYAKGIIERELNAVTDNPIVFAKESRIISGGNFHGQPLAMAFDFAAIACAEFGNVSERRLELLCNPHHSGLPAFLVKEGGINSGYMALQYLSASLVNENKLLANPACTDSIPGNVGVEDHVSMGMTSARKLRKIVENVQTVLAAELLAAGQAVGLRGSNRLGNGTFRTQASLRKHVRKMDSDRLVVQDVKQAIVAIHEGELFVL